jgi:hypothetical protein
MKVVGSLVLYYANISEKLVPNPLPCIAGFDHALCVLQYTVQHNSKLHCQQKYRQFDLSVFWSTVFHGGSVRVRTSLLIPQGAIMDRELDPKLLNQIGSPNTW